MFGAIFQKALTDEQLVKRCKQGKRSAQQALYDRFSPTMKAVCLRYAGQDFDAEDILVTGFMKVFEKIDSYSGTGSLEGWIRRVMVNEALMFLRKKNRMPQPAELERLDRQAAVATVVVEESQLHADELMSLVQALPDGYRLVFNMYAIEGYSHKEIAEKLNITVGTSKSQLSKARQMLKQWIEKQDYQQVS